MFVANRESNSVMVLDADTPDLHATIETGERPYAVAFNPINGHLYVTCVKDNSLTVIDTKTYEKIADLKPGKAPYGVTVSDDGKQFYVVNQNDNTLVEFDAGSLQITQTIKTEKMPESVELSKDQQHATSLIGLVTHYRLLIYSKENKPAQSHLRKDHARLVWLNRNLKSGAVFYTAPL